MIGAKVLVHLLAAASVVLGSPVPENDEVERGLCTKNYNANFDELAVGEVPLLNIIPTPYAGLQYKNFRSSSNGLVSTIAAHTSPNSAGFSLLTGTTGGTPTITRAYKDSPAKHFDMRSVWMSCVTINPTGVFLPVGCTVQAIGTQVNSGKKVYANLNFKAPLIPKLKLLKKKTKQQKNTFPASFRGLSKVEFKVISAGVDATLTNVAFDNFEYSIVHPCAKSGSV